MLITLPGAGLTAQAVGQARPDRLALTPYWGKPAVRNFRGGDGNVGIIRSPTRAIARPDLDVGPADSWLENERASRDFPEGRDEDRGGVTVKALSVRQPWAWAIIQGGKDIENRRRPTHIRETIAIHASLSPARDWGMPARVRNPPPEEEWVRGAILGFVDLVDCVERHHSKWFEGPCGYVLTNPRPLRTPIPCKGALGFWRVPARVLRRCRVAPRRTRR